MINMKTIDTFESDWPTDEPFRTFAAKLADAVMRACQAGYRIVSARTDDPYPCCCPLGALLLDEHDRTPTRAFPGVCAHELLGLKAGQTWAFTMGFDLGIEGNGPYMRLGRAYRSRFMWKEKFRE